MNRVAESARRGTGSRRSPWTWIGLGPFLAALACGAAAWATPRDAPTQASGGCPGQVPPVAEDALLSRPEVLAARLRLEAAVRRFEATRREAEDRARPMGMTSTGLAYLVRSGSDSGLATLGAWSAPPAPAVTKPLREARAERDAAQGAYRRVLALAMGCGTPDGPVPR